MLHISVYYTASHYILSFLPFLISFFYMSTQTEKDFEKYQRPPLHLQSKPLALNGSKISPFENLAHCN